MSETEKTEKQRKKSEYNKKYIERLKEKAKHEALKEIDADEKTSFFFPEKKEITPQVPQIPTFAENLKQKAVETTMISMISLIPLVIKCIISNYQSRKSSNNESQNMEETQCHQSSHYCPQMNLL